MKHELPGVVLVSAALSGCATKPIPVPDNTHGIPRRRSDTISQATASSNCCRSQPMRDSAFAPTCAETIPRSKEPENSPCPRTASWCRIRRDIGQTIKMALIPQPIFARTLSRPLPRILEHLYPRTGQLHPTAKDQPNSFAQLLDMPSRMTFAERP